MTRYKYPEPKSSEITPERVWKQRRQLLAGGALMAAGSALPLSSAMAQRKQASEWAPLPAKANFDFVSMEALTSQKDVTTYNNFYEFGLEKSDPAKYAGAMKTEPWSVEIEGEVAKPGTYGLEDLLSLSPMEDRVYRLRCRRLVHGYPVDRVSPVSVTEQSRAHG